MIIADSALFLPRLQIPPFGPSSTTEAHEETPLDYLGPLP